MSDSSELYGVGLKIGALFGAAATLMGLIGYQLIATKISSDEPPPENPSSLEECVTLESLGPHNSGFGRQMTVELGGAEYVLRYAIGCDPISALYSRT